MGFPQDAVGYTTNYNIPKMYISQRNWYDYYYTGMDIVDGQMKTNADDILTNAGNITSMQTLLNTHAIRHQSGGADELSLTALRGASINVDTIDEDTSDTGVTIETLLVKDGRITGGQLPESDDEFVVKQYVDQIAAGLDWQKAVLDKDVTDPSTLTPTEGDRYIVAAGAIGDWSGQDNNIAEYNGSGWDFITPNQGFTLEVEDEAKFYRFDGANWVLFASIVSHNSLSGLQGGNGSDEYYHLTNAEHTLLTAITFDKIYNQESGDHIIDMDDGHVSFNIQPTDINSIRTQDLTRNNTVGMFAHYNLSGAVLEIAMGQTHSLSSIGATMKIGNFDDDTEEIGIEIDTVFKLKATDDIDFHSSAGNVSIFAEGGDLTFDDSFLSSAIPLSQSGTTGLSGFTATSIIGALNELKSTPQLFQESTNIITTVDTNDKMRFIDNQKFTWGDADDVEIFFDGSELVITPKPGASTSTSVYMIEDNNNWYYGVGIEGNEVNMWGQPGSSGSQIHLRGTKLDMRTVGTGVPIEIWSTNELRFRDQHLSGFINMSQSGTSGLVGFTATSIIGALNELKTAGGGVANPMTEDLSTGGYNIKHTANLSFQFGSANYAKFAVNGDANYVQIYKNYIQIYEEEFNGYFMNVGLIDGSGGLGIFGECDDLYVKESNGDLHLLSDNASIEIDAANDIEIDSTNLGFYGTTPIAKPTVTGAKGGNAALTSLLTQLANLGLITDSTT